MLLSCFYFLKSYLVKQTIELGYLKNKHSCITKALCGIVTAHNVTHNVLL